MSDQKTTPATQEPSPLAQLIAAGIVIYAGTKFLNKVFSEPEPEPQPKPSRIISSYSEADFAEIIKLLGQQS